MPDPATIALALQGVSLLGNLGSSLLGRNDARDARRKAEEENKRRIAQGNLSRAFGGNPAVDLVQPKLKQGLGTKILGGVGTAAGIGSQALGAFNQAKALTAQIASRNLANEAARDNIDVARGQVVGQAGGLADKFSAPPTQLPPGAGKIGATAARADQFAAPTSQFADKLSGVSGTPTAAPQLSNFADPASVMASVGQLSDLGRLSAQGTVNARQQNMEALQEAREQQDLINQMAQERIDLTREGLTQDQLQHDATLNNRLLEEQAKSAAAVKVAEIKAAGEGTKNQDARLALRQKLDKGANDLAPVKLVNEMRGRHVSLKAILSNWKQGGTLTGTDQIAAFTNFQRFIDDAIVRSDDVNLQVSAQSVWQASIAKLNNLSRGDVVSEELILNMESAADRMFDANNRAAETAIDAYYKSFGGLDIDDRFLSSSRQSVEAATFGGTAEGGRATKVPSGDMIETDFLEQTLQKAEEGDASARNRLLMWGYESH